MAKSGAVERPESSASQGRLAVLELQRDQKYLNEAEVARLSADYESGLTVYELAKKYGCHRSTVSRHLKLNGVQMRLRSLTDDEIREATRLYDSGLSLEAVAKQLGLKPKTIRLRLIERGVQMRDSHGRQRELRHES